MFVLKIIFITALILALILVGYFCVIYYVFYQNEVYRTERKFHLINLLVGVTTLLDYVDCIFLYYFRLLNSFFYLKLIRSNSYLSQVSCNN